ncbi:hypothetical protein HPB47_000334 [Ixodes persulcatus]|uniref:Uncharacterized protein n=1 Tax=Ixodes persulcatus TaxID=34615 RepID=A0AC60PS21_IXOPE|nr:hypothetical protein HPB47_000334 [Ixodes persulcatus]
MQGRKKSRTAAQNITLALRVSENQVAAEAGQLFFSQAATPAPQKNLRTAPFAMGELISAIRWCKTNSTPGLDGIAYALLRKLPDEHSDELLTWINQIWTTVKGGNTTGTETPNGVGVPQGAVLSPTLFNLVMANLLPRLARI